MEPYQKGYYQNPSAIYLAGRKTRQKLEESRAKVSKILGAKPAEIIFTSGASEANNLAIQGVIKAHPRAKVLISPLEHDSVYAPAQQFNHEVLEVSSAGIVDVNQVAVKITDDVALISLMMISNELGTIQPIRNIAQAITKARVDRQKRGVKLPLLLHTDAAQAGNYFDLHVSRLGVDLMTINGGKLHGPKQSGVLYAKAGTRLAPLILGGGQEFGIRAGTESLPAAAGFAEALSLAQEGRKEELQRVGALAHFFATRLQKALPSSVVNGSLKHTTPHILSVTFPGADNERLLMGLDEAGIQVGMGSACSASSDKPSRALAAIGLSDKDIRSTLRFSFGHTTTQKDLSATVHRLADLTSRKP